MLKGPAAVAPIFPKTPARIRAMGLVLISALRVRNYIQAMLRDQLAARGGTIRHPFTNQQQARLTPEMAFEHFGGEREADAALAGELAAMGLL